MGAEDDCEVSTVTDRHHQNATILIRPRVLSQRVHQGLETWIWWRREVAPTFSNPLIRIFRDDHRGIRELQLVAGVFVFFLSWYLLAGQSIDHRPETYISDERSVVTVGPKRPRFYRFKARIRTVKGVLFNAVFATVCASDRQLCSPGGFFR